MAKNDEKVPEPKHPKATRMTKAERVTTHHPLPHTGPAPTTKTTWIIVSAIVAGLVGIALIAGAMAAIVSHTVGINRLSKDTDDSYGFSRDLFGPMRDGRMRGGMDYSVTQTTYQRQTGVVVSVDGNSFTIAGYGKTMKVKTDSTTKFYGDAESVKQNDTVTVTGQKSDDGTLMASYVSISRQ